MATEIQYNISSVTRQPPLPSYSNADPTFSTLMPTLHHLLRSNLHLGSHSNGNNLTLNNNHDDLMASSTANNNNNNLIPGFPPGFDPDAYGDHVEMYHYPGDVHHLTLPWVREPNFIPLVIVQALTFALGIAGNALVISVLCCGRPGRCVTFPCLLSMAVADVLFLLVCVPHEIVGYFLTHWELSAFLCKLSGFVEMTCALAAVLNLILISVERYFVIAHPLMSKSLCTSRKAKIALIATWVAAFLLSTPAFVVMDTEVNIYYNNSSHAEVVMCGDFGMDDTGRLAWAAWQLTLLFALPALVLFFCYTRVILILWLSTRQLQNMTGSRCSGTNSNNRNGHRDRGTSGVKVSGADRSLLATFSTSRPQTSSTHTRAPGEEALQARKQVIRMLVVIIVVFLVCWGPHLIINLMKRLKIKVYTAEAYHVWVMFSCLPYIQSVINPIIYVLMSKKIREAILSTPCVRCFLVCCSKTRHVKHSPTHELLTATNHSVAVAGMKTSMDTMRSYGASELTDV